MKRSWIVLAVVAFVTGMPVASASEQTVTFSVEKMTCATCPIVVRKAMQRVDGVKDVVVNYESKSATVTFDPAETSAAEIGQASSDVGFPAAVKDPG